MGKELFYIAFDVSTLPDRKLLDDVSALEDIIMVGYPNGIWDEKNNKPIFRKGITATDNKNKLQDIKKDYKLNLEFTDDGKIVYNKEHVNEILNLLLEHYVTSALTDKRMLAKAIEKYECNTDIINNKENIFANEHNCLEDIKDNANIKKIVKAISDDLNISEEEVDLSKFYFVKSNLSTNSGCP